MEARLNAATGGTKRYLAHNVTFPAVPRYLLLTHRRLLRTARILRVGNEDDIIHHGFSSPYQETEAESK